MYVVSSRTFTRQQFYPLFPCLWIGNVSHSLRWGVLGRYIKRQWGLYPCKWVIKEVQLSSLCSFWPEILLFSQSLGYKAICATTREALTELSLQTRCSSGSKGEACTMSWLNLNCSQWRVQQSECDKSHLREGVIREVEVKQLKLGNKSVACVWVRSCRCVCFLSFAGNLIVSLWKPQILFICLWILGFLEFKTLSGDVSETIPKKVL